MALQELGDGGGTDALRLCWRRRKTPEFPDPDLGEIALDLEELRVVAPELLAGPVHQPGAVAGEVVGDARPGAQFDDLRRRRIEAPEGVAVGAQRIAERMGVAAAVLGAGRREAVAEPVELLRVDRAPRSRAPSWSRPRVRAGSRLRRRRPAARHLSWRGSNLPSPPARPRRAERHVLLGPVPIR